MRSREDESPPTVDQLRCMLSKIQSKWLLIKLKLQQTERVRLNTNCVTSKSAGVKERARRIAVGIVTAGYNGAEASPALPATLDMPQRRRRSETRSSKRVERKVVRNFGKVRSLAEVWESP